MIDIQTAVPVVVGSSGGALVLPPGTWTVADLQTVWGLTNGLATNNISALRDGAVVVVDANCVVRSVDGPDLIGASVGGFGLAMSTVGVIVALKWVIARIFAPLGVGGVSE